MVETCFTTCCLKQTIHSPWHLQKLQLLNPNVWFVTISSLVLNVDCKQKCPTLSLFVHCCQWKWTLKNVTKPLVTMVREYPALVAGLDFLHEQPANHQFKTFKNSSLRSQTSIWPLLSCRLHAKMNRIDHSNAGKCKHHSIPCQQASRKWCPSPPAITSSLCTGCSFSRHSDPP